MKRARIVTETKDLVEPKHETSMPGVVKPTGEMQYSPIEELVAVSSEELKSQVVVNGKNETLGKIEDFMIDMKSGRIIYAVLSFGGLLGSGDKYFAVPWELLCVDNQWNYKDIYRKRIIFNIDKEKLENAPGFDKNQWPREPNWDWLNKVYTYYACKPSWASDQEANTVQPPAP